MYLAIYISITKFCLCCVSYDIWFSNKIVYAVHLQLYTQFTNKIMCCASSDIYFNKKIKCCVSYGI